MQGEVAATAGGGTPHTEEKGREETPHSRQAAATNLHHNTPLADPIRIQSRYTERKRRRCPVL
jgi:hypothetical protein